MARTGDLITTDDARGSAAFNQLMRLEQEAERIFLNQPLFVPGLLQVAGYATEMIGRIAGLKPGDPTLKDRVGVRMQRAEAFQKRLQGAAPPHVWAAIDEAVLRRTVGGAEIMREQLDHLIAMADLDTVHLAIIPLRGGAHPGLGGSFEVHELADGNAAVFFEAAHADEIVEDDQALAQRYRATVETMMASAVPAEGTRALLETISKSL